MASYGVPRREQPRGGDLKVKIYGEVPPLASSEGSSVGSNPKIYNRIKNEILSNVQNIEEAHFALYLFNNIDLLGVLKQVARAGSVTVTSLPLSGYDERKIGRAQKIYDELKGGLENFKLLIYPHMYVWYGAEYAGGTPSYSFHVKVGYITYKDGSSKIILTSCNLAPGDPYHSETAVIVDDPSSSTPYSSAFKEFFNQVEQLAIPWSHYSNSVQKLSKQLQLAFDFAFIGKYNLKDWRGRFLDNAFFTGPFITINNMGSTWYARKKIVDLIMSVEKRLLVAAQHIHDIAPFNGYTGETLISAIIEKKGANPSLEVKVLKQVSSKGLADKRRAAFAECHLSYAGIEQKANKLVHDKFVIADDTVLVTTSNFTATQFGWGDHKMEFTIESDYRTVSDVVDVALSLFGHPRDLVTINPSRSRRSMKEKTKVTKLDVFAEVNGFIIIEDESLANALAEYFYKLWNHSLSERVAVPR